jgi:hypothetical protein
VLLAFALSGCSDEPYESRTHDAQRFVPQQSDLPAGFNVNLAESFPLPTSKILAEPPFSPSSAAIVRRERVSGYQAAFTSPRGQTVLCSAAVYRSRAGARTVYRLRTASAAAFVAAAAGGSLRVERIGEETRAIRFEAGPAKYFGVAWRFRNVLSTCVTSPSGRQEMTTVALAQQARIAQVLDEGRK